MIFDTIQERISSFKLHKWEPWQLCPCSTPFDYKMPKLSLVDSPEILDPALVHWMQVAVGTLMYILDSRPDLIHPVHQVACFVHNPGPAHCDMSRHLIIMISCVIWQGLVIFVWLLAIGHLLTFGFWLAFKFIWMLIPSSSHKNSECGIGFSWDDYGNWGFCFRYYSDSSAQC